jgi:hypothetical protein
MTLYAGLDTVISAFIRNPELSSIKYKTEQNIIEMELILKDKIENEKQQLFRRNTMAAIHMLHKLKGKEIIDLGINYDIQGNISILTLYRDAFTLTEDEIDLYVKLAGLAFPNMLFRETDEAVLQSKVVNDIKKRLLQDISHKNDTANNIFAYRDRGKMFVFDK